MFNVPPNPHAQGSDLQQPSEQEEELVEAMTVSTAKIAPRAAAACQGMLLLLTLHPK